ncbi:MAG: hypothetical protein V8T45_06790 [Oscillospiraceae bacterium]
MPVLPKRRSCCGQTGKWKTWSSWTTELAGALRMAEAIEGYDSHIKHMSTEESRRAQRCVEGLPALAGA